MDGHALVTVTPMKKSMGLVFTVKSQKPSKMQKIPSLSFALCGNRSKKSLKKF